MDLNSGLEAVANGAMIARKGGGGDMITLHPEEPKQDPPRWVRVYPKNSKKYPGGTYRLFSVEDITKEDAAAQDWEVVLPTAEGEEKKEG